MPIPAAHSAEELAILAMPGTSYTMASHHEWPQHPDQPRSDQVYGQKQESSLPPAPFNMTAVQLHPGLHHRSEKASEHSVRAEHAHKSSSGKHHGQIYAPSVTMSHKMSLDKYREKRKLETVDLDVRDQMPTVHAAEQHKKHSQASGGSVTSPIKMKIPLASTEKMEKHSSEKKDKSGSLKLRIPIPPTERASSKEDLKMKIKVSSADRHSSSDEGSGKSKHSSPHMSKEHKDKHNSSNRHHSSHKHSHSHYNSVSSNKLCMDGLPTTVLRSPVGVPNDGGTSSSSSSRKRPHSNDASYNHHSKMSKSSKSSGTSSSSVKQYVSSHNTVLNHPLLPPPPVTYQVGYGHLSTLVKLDKKPVESNGPDASHEYGANSQHMDYKDTFDMLDSLLSAQGMNM
ncbi:hypothetical protein GDO78_023215 [Eleutherodactylus coqui]|uniref:Cyclin-T2 n=3 Tax=Eleutherodactylus coqui TaxID=57060 RepID=A0A8J6B264_ELECQ|nr:hypothetical protein GDO78_023215 [Eleutherodactylus coqui]